MGKGLLFFLLLVFAELYVMISVGKVIGALGVIALLIAGMSVGAFVIRRQQALSAEALRMGLSGSPTEALRLSSPERFMLSFFAGVLFIIPGFLSDALAVVLLLPPVQKALSRNAGKYLRSSQPPGGAFGARVFRFGSWHGNAGTPDYGAFSGRRGETGGYHNDGTVIEGEARDVTHEAGRGDEPALVIDLTAGDRGNNSSRGRSEP